MASVHWTMSADLFDNLALTPEEDAWWVDPDAMGESPTPVFISVELAAQQWFDSSDVRRRSNSLFDDALPTYSAIEVVRQVRGEEAVEPVINALRMHYLDLRAKQGGKELPLVEGIDEEYLGPRGALQLDAVAGVIGRERLVKLIRNHLKNVSRGNIDTWAESLITAMTDAAPPDERFRVETTLNAVTLTNADGA
mgnify:CR=1 FL=1